MFQTTEHLWPHLFDGINVTYMAYGITGSGKTHTIMGKNGMLNVSSPKHTGICVQALQRVFTLAHE